RVLLLDDPTRGVDVGAKAELYRLMDQLCREGLGIIVTSSELPELLTLCDRILVLCEGRLTAELSRQEATEQRIMEAATMMRCSVASWRLNSAVSLPSHSTRMRSQSVSSSGNSLDVTMMPSPSRHNWSMSR